MSEISLVIVEKDLAFSGQVHGATGDRVIAALSAEPDTLKELEVALVKYQKPWSFSDRYDLDLLPGCQFTRYDVGRILIDLYAKLIVIDSDYSDPEREGVVYFHNGHYRTSEEIAYKLADHWTITHNVSNWRGMQKSLRNSRELRETNGTADVVKN